MPFQNDVQFCARAIYTDLTGGGSYRRFADLCLLCERHGGQPLFDPTLSARQGGECLGGEILLSPFCSLAQYREILPHELVHRLADTPRWVWLNHHIQGFRYDRKQFIEAVAQLVGRMFASEQSLLCVDHNI